MREKLWHELQTDYTILVTGQRLDPTELQQIVNLEERKVYKTSLDCVLWIQALAPIPSNLI